MAPGRHQARRLLIRTRRAPPLADGSLRRQLRATNAYVSNLTTRMLRTETRT